MRVAHLAVALLAVPALLGAQTAASITRGVNSITPDDIAHRIGIIAHDSMRGRYTPSPELDETAEYIAAEFRRVGLAPGGDGGSFVQRYPITAMRLDTARSMVVVAGGPTWRVGQDVVAQFGSLTESFSGAVTIVDGGGEDVSALERADLRDRIVIVVMPATPTGNELVGALFRQRPRVVILVRPGMPDAAWQAMTARQSRIMERFGSADEGGFVVLMARDAAIAPVLARAGYDMAKAQAQVGRPVTVTQADALQFTVDIRYETVGTQHAPNTVGILEGSDPQLKHEYIVFSGHMDHSGVRTPVNGDSIMNGADDDASGTIAVVELAEAFARLQPRPKRSLIFLTVSGEERGLWGSSYFADHPTVPIGQIVANLNADMLGRNWPDTIVVIGKEHSDLGATLNRVNSAHPELGMTAIDDIWPDENFYQRSDHYNFARKGVPILFFFNGTHEDYHQVTDEVEKINAEKESRIVKLMFYLGLEIANAAERPKWDPKSYEKVVSEENN